MLFTVLQTFDHHKNYHIHGMRAAWCAYCFHEPTTAVQAIIALQLEPFHHHKNYHIHGMKSESCWYCVHELTTPVKATTTIQKGKEVPTGA